MKRLENKVDEEVIYHIDYAFDDWTEDTKNITMVPVGSLLAGANIPVKGCQFVHNFLDKYITESKEAYDTNKANLLYKRAMELELEFFNAYSKF